MVPRVPRPARETVGGELEGSGAPWWGAAFLSPEKRRPLAGPGVHFFGFLILTLCLPGAGMRGLGVLLVFIFLSSFFRGPRVHTLNMHSSPTTCNDYFLKIANSVESMVLNND